MKKQTAEENERAYRERIEKGRQAYRNDPSIYARLKAKRNENREEYLAKKRAARLAKETTRADKESFKLEVIADYQNGLSLSKIREKHGIKSPSLTRWMRERNIDPREPLPCRTHTLNEGAFDKNSRSEFSDYWAGFLAADGCVHENVSQHGQSSSWSITLALSECDHGHVEKFRKFLSSDAPIQLRIDKRNGVKLSAISVFSRRLGDQLGRLGVTPRKSFTMKAVGLEKSRHFWRGVIDGDGHIGKHERNPHLELCGSKPLMEQFAAFIGGAPVSPTKNIYRVRLCGRRAVIVMIELYGDSSVSLDRKYEAYCDSVHQYITRKPGKGWSKSADGFMHRLTGDTDEIECLQ